MSKFRKKTPNYSQSHLSTKHSQGTLMGNYGNKLLPVGLIFPFAIGYLVAPNSIDSVKASLEESPKTVVDQVWQIVNNDYVDSNFNQVDWRKKRQELLNRNYTDKQQAYKAIEQALQTLQDPYTRFLEPSEYQLLSRQTSGELSGIGIRMEIDSQTKNLVVVESLENSPASKAGIKTGDRILKINGKPTSLMSLEQASEEIRGEVGTEVKLEISRQGQKVSQLTLTRAQIEVNSVIYALKQEESMRVGYIKLNEFTSHSAKQMKKAIRDLKDKRVSSFILDVRGNPGGLLFASIEIAKMWVEKGTIVHTVDRKGGDKVYSADGTAITNLPMVVLVDGNSASSSEILAGALKDNGRATVVGTRTYGKGTVQSVHPLSDGSGLVVTIFRYYPPSRIDINKEGISPNIEQDLSAEEQLRLKSNPSLIATSGDPQYMRAIAVLNQKQSKSPRL